MSPNKSSELNRGGEEVDIEFFSKKNKWLVLNRERSVEGNNIKNQ